ncbi:MAG: VOC family protein [Oscillospiraceae bacterium]|nr:VOC family protein [Oscillospiraceae bacterium]
MNESINIRIAHIVLDCVNPSALADFYANLLGWKKRDLGPEWSVVSKPGVSPILLFQQDAEYEPPVWPDAPGMQCQMAHIDFAVVDIKRAIQHAVNCSAKIADNQYSDKWTVMLDPAGHPFCFVQNPSLIESLVKKNV